MSLPPSFYIPSHFDNPLGSPSTNNREANVQDVLNDKAAVLEKVEFYRESQYEYEDDYGGFGLLFHGMVLAGSVVHAGDGSCWVRRS